MPSDGDDLGPLGHCGNALLPAGLQSYSGRAARQEMSSASGRRCPRCSLIVRRLQGLPSSNPGDALRGTLRNLAPASPEGAFSAAQGAAAVGRHKAENACGDGCAVDTTAGGQAYVTSTALRPRGPHGRRSRRRDGLLRRAGPGDRGPDIRRGRVLGHGLRHSRLPHSTRSRSCSDRSLSSLAWSTRLTMAVSS